MSTYDSNPQQPAWTPPPMPEGYTAVPADATPSAGGDRWALIALAVSLSIVLTSCIPGFACLAPLILGIIALVQAKNAVDPSRARTYGWIATGIGILILVFAIGAIVVYGAFIAQILNNPELQNLP